jgi:hypothetical protein
MVIPPVPPAENRVTNKQATISASEDFACPAYDVACPAYMDYGKTTALFTALLLTLATVEGPGSGQLSGDVPVGEKLRMIRDRVSAL